MAIDMVRGDSPKVQVRSKAIVDNRDLFRVF